MDSRVGKGTVVRSAWCLPLEFESRGCGKVADGFTKEKLEFSAVKCRALAVLLWQTSTPPRTHHYHPGDLERPGQQQPCRRQHCGTQSGKLYPGEGPRVPSRWRWCLAQVAKSVNVCTPEKESLSAWKTPHGSSVDSEPRLEVACREGKSKGRKTH